MEKIDLAIIVVGVIVVVAAVAGAALYGGPGDAQRFDVAWNTETTELESRSETLGAGGGDAEFTYHVTQMNLTQAVFTATVNVGAEHLAQDEVVLTVVPPGGNETTETATISPGANQVTLEATVDLADVPDASLVTAESAEEALAQLAAEHTTAQGVGNWTVTVSVEHGGTALTGDHEVTVEGELTHFLAHVTPSVGDIEGV